MSELSQQKADILAELKRAVTNTTADIKRLEGLLEIGVLEVRSQRMVADAPNGDVYVAVAEPLDGGRTSIGFCYAPLAQDKDLLQFGLTESRYLDSVKRSFAAQEEGRRLENVRFITKREFSALLIPVLREIVANTSEVITNLEKE